MKPFRLLVLSVLPAALFAAPVDSSISAVTVYADRAVVTRAGTAELTPGIAEIVFSNLPQALDDRSLQVTGKGTAQVTILDVSAKRAFVDFAANPRVKTLEDELKALMKQNRALDDRTNLLQAQSLSLDRIEGAVFSAPGEKAPRLEINAVTATMAYLTEQKAKISSDRATLDEERETLQAKLNAVQAQLNELRGSAGRAFKNVTVRVQAATAGSLDVTLAYTVPGASWVPSYDARIASGEKSLGLGYFGLVRQNTGEDWKNVALTLSTARPSLGGAAPKLFAWTIDVYQTRVSLPMPTVAEMEGFSKARTSRYSGAAPLQESALAVDATTAQATLEAGTTSASFKIATAASVPSDNSQQKIPITSTKLDAAPEYLTVPKTQTTAFLTSKVTNTSDFPLIAGALNVFLDGTFVATSQLATVMPGEKFDLALGADEGISVKHKRVQRFTENTGLTNSGVRITYEYLLTLQNNKTLPAKVVVHDQVPVSRNEKIVVKVLAPDAKTAKPDDEGKLTWTLDLKPGEKRDLTVKFTIEHPKDVTVEGLDQ